MIEVENLDEPLAAPLITVNFKSYAYCKIETEEGVQKELSTYFAIPIPNFAMLRKFNKKFWNMDGKIRLFNLKTKQLGVGLLPVLYGFCKERGYRLTIAPNYKQRNELTNETFNKFILDLNVPMEPYDYQLDAVRKAITLKRLTCMIPTGGGKSLVIYMYTKWCLQNTVGKVLIIVPTTTLVHQLENDFTSYGNQEPVHIIMAGMEKESEKRIFISTWQSIYLLEESYYDKFETIILDEAHVLKVDKISKSVLNTINKTNNAHYRLGMTGTIENTNMHRLQIEAMFGSIYKPTSMKELIDRGLLSGLKVHAVRLVYPDDVKEMLNKLDWDIQQQFVEDITNPRQRLIIDLAISLKENCLILFRKIEHGTFIYEELLKNCKKDVYYVDGSVKSMDRNDIRKIIETKKDAIVVASFATFSAGISIKRLHYLIMSSSTKSQVRLLQSIGRSLRLHETKDHATIYDFVDMFYYLARHFTERKKIYNDEQIEYDEREIDLVEYTKKKGLEGFK